MRWSVTSMIIQATRAHRGQGRVSTPTNRRSLGQSLVEFALILPVFLFLLAAVLDLGRVFYAHISLTNAAREGAFEAASNLSYQEDQPCSASNEVVCRIQAEAEGSMVQVQPTDIDVTCSLSGCPAQAASYVTVEVRGTFNLLTPLLATVFNSQTLSLGTAATAQVEYLPDPTTPTLPPTPVAAFTATPSSGAAPLDVAFDASSSTGDPTDWSWDFGDGAQDTGSQTTSHQYGVDGTYTVTLTAINLAGADTETMTITVTATPGPTPTPTATPTPPPCQYPPNVIGMTPANSQAALINAGFTNFIQYGDLTNGNKDKIQAQNPDHTQCIDPSTQIITHYRPS